MTTRPVDHRAVMAGRVESDVENPDLFLTPPWGYRAVGEIIRRLDPQATSVAENACGPGLGVHGLRDYFPTVHATDKFQYGWGHRIFDFLDLSQPYPFAPDWIVTNPPFGRKVEPFIRRSYAVARRGVAMLLQTRALEGISRHKLFEDLPLSRVCPFAERLPMGAGRWDPGLTTATSYTWFILLKPQRRGQAPDRSGARIAIPPGTRDRLFRLDDLQFAMRGKVQRVSVLPPIEGAKMTERHAMALIELAKCPRGSGPVHGVMPGGMLAALVQFGLAERMADDLGGTRYRISDLGWTVGRGMGWMA